MRASGSLDNPQDGGLQEVAIERTETRSADIHVSEMFLGSSEVLGASEQLEIDDLSGIQDNAASVADAIAQIAVDAVDPSPRDELVMQTPVPDGQMPSTQERGYLSKDSKTSVLSRSESYMQEVRNRIGEMQAMQAAFDPSPRDEFVVQTPVPDGQMPSTQERGLLTKDSKTSVLSRGESYMQEVRNRIGEMQAIQQEKACIDQDFLSEHSHSTRRARTRRRTRNRSNAPTPWSAAAAAMAERTIVDNVEGVREMKCLVPFRLAILGTVTTTVLMSCVGMLIPVEMFQEKMQETSKSCTDPVDYQRTELLQPLEENVTSMRYASLLEEVDQSVQAFVKTPADRAVDAIWGNMVASRLCNSSMGRSRSFCAGQRQAGQTQELLYRSWVELAQQGQRCQGGLECPQRAFGIAVSFGPNLTENSGYLIGCASAGDFGGCDSANAFVWDRSGSNASSIRSTFSGDGSQSSPQPSSWVPSLPLSYALQESLRERYAGTTHEPVRAWSELHDLWTANGEVARGITWTAPIAYCRTYDCFEGVVTSTINLLSMGNETRRIWARLRNKLHLDSMTYNTPVILNHESSSVFIVSYVKNSTEQWGNLIASSHVHEGDIDQGSRVKAVNSSQEIIRATARELLRRYGSWEGVGQREQGEANFRFRRQDALMNPPEIGECDMDNIMEQGANGNCLRVGARTVDLDEQTRWILVAALPEGAFSAKGTNTQQQVQKEIGSLPEAMSDIVESARIWSLATFVGMAVLSIGLGLSLGALVSRPLKGLGVLLMKLGELDFTREGSEYDELRPSKRATIKEVQMLQEAFIRLSRGTEAFARFVPETVVHNIIHGERDATSLCLEEREITIMNSDIQGFTSMTEGLPHRDLLFLLTRYLSVMQRVVKAFDGVVSEIQGDGLIALWNTPDDVEDHAAKACSAALAQQLALSILNTEFENLKLPTMTIRIGLHTGKVRSGNIGSEKKMKFGCLGEPMKVASHLEEICKEYSVNVVCSADTFQHLPVDDAFNQFQCRRLDCVKIGKGDEMTWIYEVMGRTQRDLTGDTLLPEDNGCDPESTPASSVQSKNHSSVGTLPEAPQVVTEAIRRSTSSLVSPAAPFWRPIRSGLWWRQKAKEAKAGADPQSSPSYEISQASADSDLEHFASQEAGAIRRSVTVGSFSALSKSLEVSKERCRHVEQYEEALTAFHEGRYREAYQVSKALSEEFNDVATKQLVSRSRSALEQLESELPKEERPCEGGDMPELGTLGELRTTAL